MSALRAAIVGLGNVAWRYPGAGATHFDSYRQLGVQCVAGCDPDPAAREAFAKATKAQVHESVEAIPDVDIVSICSPEAVHFEQAAAVLRRGVRMIWLEKPPAATAAQARALAAQAEECGATIAVNFFRRYHPAFEKAKALQPRMLRLQYSRGLLPNGIHQLDALHFLTGDTRDFRVVATDGANAILEAGELRAVVSGTDLPYHVQETEVLCDSGRVRIALGGGELRTEQAIDNPAYPGFRRLAGTETVEHYEEPGQGFPRVLADLLAAHAGSREPVSSLRTAIRAMALYEQIAHGDPRRGG